VGQRVGKRIKNENNLMKSKLMRYFSKIDETFAQSRQALENKGFIQNMLSTVPPSSARLRRHPWVETWLEMGVGNGDL
jgi:hypothetical protein